MEFREATVEDIESIQRVARASWHQAHDHIIGEEAVDAILDMWYDRESLVESLGQDDG